MLTTLMTLVLAATVPAGHTDTSFTVPSGAQLAVHNFQGAIVVRPGPKNIVRIEAEHGERTRVEVTREGSAWDVRARMHPRRPASVEYKITAPAWMSLDLEGVQGDVDVEGWKSDVIVETVNGDVTLRGGEGLIRLSSVTGEVTVDGAQGRIQLSSVQGDVGVRDATGEISVETVIGDVRLDRVRSRLLETESVNGDIDFEGWIDDDGRYRFSTHSGDLDIQLPPQGDATVSVSTFSGGFESAFPMGSGGTRPGRDFRFTLGTGKAAVDLESFMGTINLRRGEPGDRDTDRKHEAKNERKSGGK